MVDDYQVRKDIDNLSERLSDVKTVADNSISSEMLDEKLVDYPMTGEVSEMIATFDYEKVVASLPNFSIDTDGHLIVTYPEEAQNEFYINNEGHIIFVR